MSIQDLPATKQSYDVSPFLNTLKQVNVVKRNGHLANFDTNRIKNAVTSAFLDLEGGSARDAEHVHDAAQMIVFDVCEVLCRRWPAGGTVHVEDIQDMVEIALMRRQCLDVAKAYILYRSERAKERAEQGQTPTTRVLHMTTSSGDRLPLTAATLNDWLQPHLHDLSDVTSIPIAHEAFRSLFEGIPEVDVRKALTMAARSRIELEPNYAFVASRLLLDQLHHEVNEFLALGPLPTTPKRRLLRYRKAFAAGIERGVEAGIFDPLLLDFNLERLAEALEPEQDGALTYLSAQTLYDRYFVHVGKQRIELPQGFFMRVAMGLALREAQEEREERTIEFYRLLSSLDYMCSTPTLFNAGTTRSQLSSCYLTTVPDDLDGIYSAIRDNALLSKFAGGLGNDWTPVRSMGSHIQGTNGQSQGVVPFLNVADATAIAVNQGGKRKGAVCAYLETWHRDIEEFLELRKNTGDDRRRTHDMNTANWVPDLFMERVHQGGDWTLFSPCDVPDLHDVYGEAFKQAYETYEAQAAEGKIPAKTIPAVTLWRKMLTMLFETGHPWMTFKDPCNLRSPQQHVGVVHSSNLCTEITLNTSAEEIAVCNLGSINLPQHMGPDGLDVHKLRATIKTALRMLDNVIDINFYAVPQAERSNLKHRPIGLGMMGFQDALHLLRIPYASDDAVTFADRTMEAISYHAIEASIELAIERGPYESYKGSLWSQGILPIDSIDLLKATRSTDAFQQDASKTLDWDSLRQRLLEHGIRNSNVMAIAPTATISNICGVSASIEPTFQNLFVKSNLSGEFTVVNPYLVNDLKELGLWDNVMVNDLKFYNGSIQAIERIPSHLKALYATAFEFDPLWLIKAASRRQKWLDQAQSLNLYVAEPSGKKLDRIYRSAWTYGLKTTYYLRTLAATSTEKSTLHTGQLNAVKACRIDDPDCEACQ